MSKLKSRAERYEEILSDIDAGVMIKVEELKIELEEWQANMPENLQNGAKYEDLQEAIDSLQEVYDLLQEAHGITVNFLSR